MRYLLLLLLASCSSMNKDDCLTANWKELGVKDSVAGKSIDSLLDRKSTCSNHGVSVDFDAYKKGYDEGLKVYCTSERGLNTGESGSELNLICSDEIFSAYKQSYLKGLSSFCSIVNAVNLGKKGSPYPKVCSPDKFIDFYNIYTQEKANFDHNKFLVQSRHEHFLIHTKIHLNTRKITCSSDIDCEQRYFCNLNKCSQSGISCTFDSDCSFSGICNSNKICRF